MAFMGNNFNRFARDVARMEVAASDVKLRESNPEQAREDHGGRIAAHLALLAVGLVLLFLLGRGLFAKPATEQEKKEFFYQFTAEQMAVYKPDYFLYEKLSAPAALLKGDGWQRTAAADAQSAADKLLGGCTLSDWTDLVLTECARMWEDWYYGTEDITSDNYILREIGWHIDNKTLPGLGENTWLVTDLAGVQYILAHADGIWGVKPLEDFK